MGRGCVRSEGRRGSRGGLEVAFVGLDRWVGEWVDGDDGGGGGLVV